ncbi:MAG: xylulokinase [Aestuariivita sp.]|nr:xylulokinase [Aestuariivita sp.]
MYLGLDLGTSGLRGILVTESWKIVGEATAVIDTQTPNRGWSEQSPMHWIEACKDVVVQLREANRADFASVRSVGLSGHMHGATLLDVDGQVLRPCIMWNDTRAHREAQILDQEPQMREITGNIVFPGFTAPKLEWVRLNEPDVHSKIAKVLLPKDYLRFWLTGEYLSEMSDSSGTSWLNVGKRCWSDTALTLSGADVQQMPRLIEGSEVGGEIRTELLQEWGVTGPVFVAGGAGDNAAVACGVGCVNEGDGLLSLGTSGVLLVAKETYVPAPQSALHCFCHALPNRWLQMGVILSATNCLNWLSRNLGKSVDSLMTALPDNLDGPTGITFLPYLSGERTPHNDSNIRAAFVCLDVSSNSIDLTRSVIECVAYAMRDCMETLRITDTEIVHLFATGGGAQSRYWLEILATVLGRPLSLPEGSYFGAAMGAARLAGRAVSAAHSDDVFAFPNVIDQIDPRIDLIDHYEDGFQRFRQSYRALAPLADH